MKKKYFMCGSSQIQTQDILDSFTVHVEHLPSGIK
jgi:hypothetical protein